MYSIYIISKIFSPLFMLALVHTIWFQMGVVAIVIIGALIFHKVKVNTLKAQKGELQRKLDERNELFLYATEREKKSREEAELASRTKSELLVKISHEIRTPMNGVIGMASLLSETSLNPEQKEYNNTIRTCGESLLTVINDILLDDVLAYSKVESGKLGGDQKEFDISNSIEEVLDVFGAKAAKANIELVYHIMNDVPQQVIGDSSRFRQVLMNLVENAVKYTMQGEIVIKVNLIAIKNGDTVELGVEVIDTGIGILEDRVKQLMVDFSEMDAVTDQYRVSGLGLTICKRLVGLMGGHLEVKSEIGKGTTLKFNMCAVLKPQLTRHTTSKDWAGQEGKKILLVENNISCAKALQDKLEQWKLAPTVVHSGKDALEILATAPNFDLVIADMDMPEMNGIELSSVIQQQQPELPIILLVKDGEESHKLSSELFNSIVTKPIKQHVLSKHILSGLRNKGKAVSEGSTQILSADFSKKYPLRILIAEDNKINQKLAMRVLGKLGYDPDIAQNGKEVLEEVSHTNYDLILMDVQMPEMDGLEATRMMRLCLTVQPIIVAMTANTMQGDREECLQAGMDDYISKPINLEELVIVLEKWALQVNTKS